MKVLKAIGVVLAEAINWLLNSIAGSLGVAALVTLWLFATVGNFTDIPMDILFFTAWLNVFASLVFYYVDRDEDEGGWE